MSGLVPGVLHFGVRFPLTYTRMMKAVLKADAVKIIVSTCRNVRGTKDKRKENGVGSDGTGGARSAASKTDKK